MNCLKIKNKIVLSILFFWVLVMTVGGSEEEKKIENVIRTVLEREMNYYNYLYNVETFKHFTSNVKRNVFYRKAIEDESDYDDNKYFIAMQLFPDDSFWDYKDCFNTIEYNNRPKGKSLQKFILCAILLNDKKDNGIIIGTFSFGYSSLQYCRYYLPLRDEFGNKLPDAPKLSHDKSLRIAYEKKINDLACDYLLDSNDKELHTFYFTFKEKELVFTHDAKWIKTRQLIEKNIAESLEHTEPSPEYVFLFDFGIYDSTLYGFVMTKNGKESYMLEFKTIRHDTFTEEINEIYVGRSLYSIDDITGEKLYKYLKNGLIYKVEKDPNGKISLLRIK